MPFPSFENTNVLVVGDAMLDRYWHGSADRVSAEAPVPVVKVAEVEDRPGGAANVALNIVALGGKASLVSVVGKDQEARILRNKLETAGINCVFHESDSERTTTKLRVISKNQQLIRADFELREGRFSNVSLSGDFFCFPEEAIRLLEARLEGQPIQEAHTLLKSFYSKEAIETPGIGIDDWMRVLKIGGHPHQTPK